MTDSPQPAVALHWHALALALAALAIWALFRFSALDIWLADRMYDPVLQRFAWQHDVWLDWINHRLAKYAIVAWGGYCGYRAWRRRDTRLALAVAALALACLVVAQLKAHSLHSCPWDLLRYHGSAQGFGLFEALPLHPGPGHCFPAGHASSGFALLAFAYYWRGRDRQRALGWTLLALAVGMAMGLGQQLRGAHFLSHTLWAAWWCWAVTLAVFGGAAAWQRATRRPPLGRPARQE